MIPSQVVVCPSCGRSVKPGKFCAVCGAPLTTAPAGQQATGLPLYTLPGAVGQEQARALGESRKLEPFSLGGKRTLIGKKPEEYVVLQNIQTSYSVFVRVHGVYSALYVVEKVFPLDVGSDAVKVEVAGAKELTPNRGVLELQTRIRKEYRSETTVVYDERANEVRVALPDRTGLQPMPMVPPPLNQQELQRLLATALELAKKVIEFRVQKVPVSAGTIESENLDLSDQQVVLSPFYLLAYANTKTGETKTLSIDGVSGTVAPLA